MITPPEKARPHIIVRGATRSRSRCQSHMSPTQRRNQLIRSRVAPELQVICVDGRNDGSFGNNAAAKKLQPMTAYESMEQDKPRRLDILSELDTRRSWKISGRPRSLRTVWPAGKRRRTSRLGAIQSLRRSAPEGAHPSVKPRSIGPPTKPGDDKGRRALAPETA
jgi:hypothetical protein